MSSVAVQMINRLGSRVESIHIGHDGRRRDRNGHKGGRQRKLKDHMANELYMSSVAVQMTNQLGSTVESSLT